MVCSSVVPMERAREGVHGWLVILPEYMGPLLDFLEASYPIFAYWSSLDLIHGLFWLVSFGLCLHPIDAAQRGRLSD